MLMKIEWNDVPWPGWVCLTWGSDEYMHALVVLPRGSQMMHGTIKACKRDLDGNPICWQSDNPILDTCFIDIELPDDEVTLLTANMTAQAMYAQCDIDRNVYFSLECFVDIKKDSTAISLDDQKAVHNGQEYLHHTTLSLHKCFQWKEGSKSWEKLLDVNESHILQIAKNTVAMHVDHKPGFNW